MKATGIVRNLDDLGRVVIPKGIRTAMGFSEGDPMEIFTNDNMVLIRKYTPGCMADGCNEANNLVEMQGVRLCRGHATAMVKALERAGHAAR